MIGTEPRYKIDRSSSEFKSSSSEKRSLRVRPSHFSSNNNSSSKEENEAASLFPNDEFYNDVKESFYFFIQEGVTTLPSLKKWLKGQVQATQL